MGIIMMDKTIIYAGLQMIIYMFNKLTDDYGDGNDNDDCQAKYGDYDESTYQPGLLANEELLPQRVRFSNSNQK